jgi:hypothetical protein
MKGAPTKAPHVVDFLNYVGSDGWEMCAVTSGATELGHEQQFVFKRALP